MRPPNCLGRNTLTRVELRAAKGVLLVLREPPLAAPAVVGQPPVVAANRAEGAEVLLAVWRDGSVTALAGHVDLGTGLATALSQLVAEELNIGVDDVTMRLGDTAAVPNQGPTIASSSIQIHALPLRQAAALARLWLNHRDNELAIDEHVEIFLDATVALKPVADYRIVGTATPRLDIPAKAMGEWVFVHDMRLPGMLHGRVVRPPYAGLDQGDFVGNTLDAVEESSIAHIPGIRAVVVIGDFVGVVAEREENAERAMRELVVRWKPWPGMPSVDHIEQALRTNDSTKRMLVDEGNVEIAMSAAHQRMPRTYVWPYQLHASIGPSCAVADWRSDASGVQIKAWSGTQNPHVLRADIAKLMAIDELQVDIVRMEAAGCYGRNGADDVTADAALMSRAVSAPVRVQLTRAQENQWEPKGAAQLMTVQGGLNADGSPAAYDFETSYPSNAAPTLALLLTRTIEPLAQTFEMGDRTARPPYHFANLRVAVNDMPPILRASWLRGVSALPNSFAHESYIDELAVAAGVDPVAYRLRYLNDERAAELVRATANRAGWQTRNGLPELEKNTEIVSGQGFAYARYIHSQWPGYGAAWAAWVADVEVNQRTGEVHVKRIVVGHDAGLVVNPAGVQHQVHGNVLQTTSRALKEAVKVSAAEVQSREWGSYPILSFREVPVIEVLHIPRPFEAPLGVGESASVPGTAAIANAIFDATGVRFRQPPFTPELVREGLREAGLLQSDLAPPNVQETHAPTSQTVRGNDVVASWATPKSRLRHIGRFALGAFGVVVALIGWRSGLAPTPISVASTALKNPFTREIMDRGRELAAIGNCIGCHSAENGIANAGGRPLETPFGTVYSTNLTPDRDTGIGAWSLAAFTRAMREGISRDGRHLYPAFPFTSFARTTDDDMLALYAFLMNEPAVRSTEPANALRFPYDQRSLLAGWNGLFHDATPFTPDPAQNDDWNRGAYLVNGLGHCGACHTPRNAWGAEKTGTSTLTGTMVYGWFAPPLSALSSSPIPWTADAFYDYLRRGYSREHGAANGQMAQVVKTLSGAPDADIQAMAAYLASLVGTVADTATQRAAVVRAGERSFVPTSALGAQLFAGACQSCHHAGDGPKLVGLNIPLALNTHIHSENPDNLLRVILHGVRAPVSADSSYMLGFNDAFDDSQMIELMGYLRERFAPQQPPWKNLAESVVSARRASTP